jgi:DNA polymerase III delta prime subunit
MSQSNKISHIYNPANQSYEELLKNFVIRKKEFKKVLREFEDVDFNTSSQHFLIEGQRGTGKTSLLLRLRYEVENNPKYSKLLAVQFAEEQYNIFDLCRLWESTADRLEDVDGFENLSNEMEQMSEGDSYSIECFSILEKYLKKSKKRLVLFLDNFGDILDKLSDIEQKRLRDIFHSSNYIQLVASSSRALEHTYKHDKPFFEFFKIIQLDGLNKVDTNLLLRQLAKTVDKDIEHIIKTQANRIETIRRLTGGIPRTIVLLFEIFLDDSANVFEDLEMILDRVTPLYKHRMDDLPTQQQAIMDVLALSWDGITSKEIVQGLSKRGFDTNKVSAQLNILVKNNLVLSRNIDKKNKLYMVKERFFNIWYLMRYGRKKNKSQVLWLVRFLQEWCSRDELEDKAKNHIECAKNGTLHSKGGVFMAEALSALLEDDKLQHELLLETKNALRKSDKDIDRKISESDLELKEKAMKAFNNDDLKLALKYIRQIQYGEGATYYMLASILFLFNSQFLESMSFTKKYINNYLLPRIDSELYEDIRALTQDYFILILAKKQYHSVYKLFEEFPQLKDQFKPIYYVIMRHLKEEYPKEYLKMGSELDETVKEIEEEILRVRELRG